MATSKIDLRFAALWRFGVAITTLNVLGHTFFGFEQSWAQPFVALATAYTLDILFELIDAHVQKRPLRFVGGIHNLISFLLPAHITALAVAMLLYFNEQLLAVIFAVTVAIASKAIFRVRTERGTHHFLNPSNFGITITLICFPWVGVVPPYHFTTNLDGWGDWVLPGLIVLSGTFLNAKFTGKVPLILGWLGGYVLQAIVRNLLFGANLTSSLVPMTGLAFVLFTFYMITDPGTTPTRSNMQVYFGLAVAALYGLLVSLHIVFGLFIALTIVCFGRGLYIAAHSYREWLRSVLVPTKVTVLLEEVDPQ